MSPNSHKGGFYKPQPQVQESPHDVRHRDIYIIESNCNDEYSDQLRGDHKVNGRNQYNQAPKRLDSESVEITWQAEGLEGSESNPLIVPTAERRRSRSSNNRTRSNRSSRSSTNSIGSKICRYCKPGEGQPKINHARGNIRITCSNGQRSSSPDSVILDIPPSTIVTSEDEVVGSVSNCKYSEHDSKCSKSCTDTELNSSSNSGKLVKKESFATPKSILKKTKPAEEDKSDTTMLRTPSLTSTSSVANALYRKFPNRLDYIYDPDLGEDDIHLESDKSDILTKGNDCCKRIASESSETYSNYYENHPKTFSKNCHSNCNYEKTGEHVSRGNVLNSKTPLTERTVSFSSVDIQEFKLTLGNHPNSVTGPPVMLDHNKPLYSKRMSLDEYERVRIPERKTSRRQLRIPGHDRKNMLIFECGFSVDEIHQAWAEAITIRHQRQETLQRGTLLSTVDDLVESVQRKCSRMTGLATSCLGPTCGITPYGSCGFLI